MPNSLAFRLLAAAALWSALALAAAGWFLASLFQDTVERNFDARLAAHLENLVALSEVDPEGVLNVTAPLGELRFRQPYSGYYWQIDGTDDTLLRSRSLWDQVIESPRATGTAIRRDRAPGPDGQTVRVIARNIVLPGASGAFLYRVAGDEAETRAEISRFNGIIGWSLGILIAVLLAAIFLQVRFGLRPLARLGAALADIRAGRGRRLEGTFATEIAPLADELNALVDHNAAVIERARGAVGNLAHAMKTPLSVLTNEAEGVEGPLADVVRRQSTLMRRQVDHYLARARTAGAGGTLSARTDVADVIEDLRRTLARIHAERDLAFDVACPPALAFRGERQDLEEMLGNLMDNACKWAGARVRVEVVREGPRLSLSVDDDGPGLPPEERLAVLERGKRLDEEVPGSGLGLAIVADIAGLYGGTIALGDSGLGGLSAALDLPAAEDAPAA